MTVVYEKLLRLVRTGLTNIEIAPYGFHPFFFFMFLLILYFRMLDDSGKTASLFSRPCPLALLSPWLFLLSTDFLAQF